MSVFDWSEFDDFDDEDEQFFEGEDDEPIYFNPFTGLFPVVERIREYVQDDYSRYTPDVVREIEAVERYIERGMAKFERLLSNHAAFDAYLAERSEDVA